MARWGLEIACDDDAPRYVRGILLGPTCSELAGEQEKDYHHGAMT